MYSEIVCCIRFANYFFSASCRTIATSKIDKGLIYILRIIVLIYSFFDFYLWTVMSPTHQMIITAILVLLCYPSQVTSLTFASVTQCTETNSIANRVLVGHAFFTKQSPDIEDCVISCINRDPLCDSTNYYRETKVCEMNDKNAESNPDDLVDYEWAIYMTNSVRLLRCNTSDYECGRQTDICQIKQGGNKCEGKIKPLA